jgi:CRISPR system Cascade subunit CasA
VSYNLLVEKWIPVVRRSGERDDIAPWQIGEADDPPLRIETPRPDFDGALLQFLIGLVQTTAAPVTKREWERIYEAPPPSSYWQDKFAPVVSAFNLDGDGPRFMQDLDGTIGAGETRAISSMLIESPGDQTIKNNADIFIKRGGVRGLSRAMAAAALYTLQANAPAGGQGHRTSLRGGGPLTTVLIGDTLFRTVWLNTLRADAFAELPGDVTKTAVADTFPWMGPTRTSGKVGGRDTTPSDIHPALHFWAMPRRIRFDFESAAPGHCDLSGREEPLVLGAYGMPNYGANYKGAFLHPLTPYVRGEPTEPPNPKKLGDDGIPYRDWPHYAGGSEQRSAARVVSAFVADGRARVAGPRPQLLAFGFNMDNMKPLAWTAVSVPVIRGEGEKDVDFVAAAFQLVEASESVRKTLSSCLRDALDRRGDLKWDASMFSALNRSFWAATEPGFYAIVERLCRALTEGAETAPIVEEWLKTLHGVAKRFFSEHSQETGDFAATDVRRVAKAWQALCRFTHWKNKQLRTLVGLPEVEEERAVAPPQETT